MFWSAKSPIDADDEEWQLECWRWLLKHYGGVANIQNQKLVLPTREFFDWPALKGEALARNIFDQVARYMDVDPADFDLVVQDEAINPVVGPYHVVQDAPIDALGTYSLQGNRGVVTYDPALLGKPMRLVGTFAHEICHPLLLTIPDEPPGGSDMEEFATDLAVTFFGFGVINANVASNFVGFRDDASGAQGWKFDGQGYLSPAERAFALAVYLQLAGKPASAVQPYLEQGPAAYFAKAAKYVGSNAKIIDALRQEFPG